MAGYLQFGFRITPSSRASNQELLFMVCDVGCFTLQDLERKNKNKGQPMGCVIPVRITWYLSQTPKRINSVLYCTLQAKISMSILVNTEVTCGTKPQTRVRL